MGSSAYERIRCRVGGARLGRRLGQLLAGLALYGLSMALMIRSGLGNMPWDVLHEGLVLTTGLSFAPVVVGVSAAVMLAWVPLRQRPGVGTLANAVLVGVFADIALASIPDGDGWPVRVTLAVSGVLLNAVATAAYIGVQLGPGPRDGLMTGLVRTTGGSLWLIRTSIEVAVVAVGWALGGTLGVVTVVYALSIGPLVQPLLPRLTVTARHPSG